MKSMELSISNADCPFRQKSIAQLHQVCAPTSPSTHLHLTAVGYQSMKVMHRILIHSKKAVDWVADSADSRNSICFTMFHLRVQQSLPGFQMPRISKTVCISPLDQHCKKKLQTATGTLHTYDIMFGV